MFVVYERSEALDNCDEKNKYYEGILIYEGILNFIMVSHF